MKAKNPGGKKGMPCGVCTSPALDRIERAVLAGQPDTVVGARFGIHPKALGRHRRNHMAHLPTVPGEPVVRSVSDRMEELVEALERKFLEVQRSQAPSSWASFVKEYRSSLMDLARLRREWDDSPKVNLVLLPEWVAARTAMVEALAPFPEARAAVADRLRLLEAGQ